MEKVAYDAIQSIVSCRTAESGKEVSISNFQYIISQRQAIKQENSLTDGSEIYSGLTEARNNKLKTISCVPENNINQIHKKISIFVTRIKCNMQLYFYSYSATDKKVCFGAKCFNSHANNGAPLSAVRIASNIQFILFN